MKGKIAIQRTLCAIAAMAFMQTCCRATETTTVALTTTVHTHASSSEKQLAANLLALLEVEVSQNTSLDVVERQQLDLALHELILNRSLAGDETTKLQLGKLDTADLILTAKLLKPDEAGQQQILVRITESLTGAIQGATVAPISDTTIEQAAEQIARYLLAVIEKPKYAGVSISVAPFESLGKFGRLRPLELGLRDLVTAQLWHGSRFQVLQRSDMAQLLTELDLIRSGLADHTQLPDTLPSRAAAYHLRGTIKENNQEAELHVVVDAQLIHAESGRVVVDIQFEAPPTDVPDALAREVYRMIALLSKESELANDESDPSKDFDATKYLFDQTMRDVYRFIRYEPTSHGYRPFFIPGYKRPENNRTHLDAVSPLSDHLMQKSIDRLESILFVRPDRMDVAYALAYCLSFHRDGIWQPERAEHLFRQVFDHNTDNRLGILALNILARMYFHHQGNNQIDPSHEKPALRCLLFAIKKYPPKDNTFNDYRPTDLVYFTCHLYRKRKEYAAMAEALVVAERLAKHSGSRRQESIASAIMNNALWIIRHGTEPTEPKAKMRQLLLRWSEGNDPWLIAYGSYGLAWLAEGVDERVRLIQRAAATLPDLTDPDQQRTQAKFLISAAYICRKSGNPQAALEILLTVKSIHHPRLGLDGHYGGALARCYEDLGMKAEALETYLYYAEEAYGFSYTNDHLDRLRKLGGVPLNPDRDIEVKYLTDRLSYHCLVTDSKRLFFGGGNKRNQNRRYEENLGVHVYEIASKTWSKLDGPTGYVMSLACDGNLLWVGTRKEGLWRCNLSTGQWKQWTTEDGLPTNSITKLLVHGESVFASVGKMDHHPRGIISGGVVRIDSSDQIHVYESGDTPVTAPNCMIVQNNKLLALARWHLYELDLATEQWRQIPDEGAGSMFLGKSAVWLSETRKELYRYGASDQENEFYRKAWFPGKTPTHGYRVKFLIEKDDQLWFGGISWRYFKTSGFYRFDLKTGEFKMYGPRDGFRYGNSSDYSCYDGVWLDGRFWLATSAGIAEVKLRKPKTDKKVSP